MTPHPLIRLHALDRGLYRDMLVLLAAQRQAGQDDILALMVSDLQKVEAMPTKRREFQPEQGRIAA